MYTEQIYKEMGIISSSVSHGVRIDQQDLSAFAVMADRLHINTLFIWQKAHDTSWAVQDNILFIRAGHGKDLFFLPPFCQGRGIQAWP